MKTFKKTGCFPPAMIEKEFLARIMREQHEQLKWPNTGIERALASTIRTDVSFVNILSGIRRSGKSTLLRQIINKKDNTAYLTFEDPRTAAMNIDDYDKLLSILRARAATLVCFDEVQNLEQWERVIRGLLDMNFHVIVTGSTASLLSKELGTKLTGRHRTHEVFPFSYAEFLKATTMPPGDTSFKQYLWSGGFPEYVLEKNVRTLNDYFNDILARDVILKQGIREHKTLRDVALFLLSNIGKEYSHNQLAKTFSLGSPATAISYVHALEECYMFFTIPKFEHSLKKQRVNPKKVYAIDTGFAFANSKSTSNDEGRLFENAVFLHLRMAYKDMSYYRRTRECDFVVLGKDKQALQACSNITQDNLKRELEGIHEAMDELKITKGIIVTLNQEDTFGNVKAVPAWKWMLNET